jgi:hypothetical protein
MENIGILQEMGIPIEEAVELLQKSKSIEEAIDLYLTRPKFTFSGATLPKRPTVVQKILEPDWKVEGYQQKIKEYHTGLAGLQGVSISPLIQVLARWSEASQILFQTKFTFEPIVSTLELKQVPFSQRI